jgi:hypothetical protein
VRGVSYLALIVIPVKFFPYLAHIVISLKNASASCIKSWLYLPYYIYRLMV